MIFGTAESSVMLAGFNLPRFNIHHIPQSPPLDINRRKSEARLCVCVCVVCCVLCVCVVCCVCVCGGGMGSEEL
jgi:hypothetical protein